MNARASLLSTLLAWSACPSLTSPHQHREGAFVMIPECVTPPPLRIKVKGAGGAEEGPEHQQEG